MADENGHPRVFISYSWAVQDQVKKLADRLIEESGIDVCLDLYDLHEGEDICVFMERTVDDAIDKVLIICDKTYRDKANAREGGVGNEVTIMSPKIYKKINPQKFIPIVWERDEKNNPCLPNFLESKKYIDFSDDESMENNYESLVRNIYGKPMYVKPPLGPKPSFLENDEDNDKNLYAIRKLIRTIKNYRQEQFETFSKKVRKEFVSASKQYALDPNKLEEQDIINAINSTIDFRNVFIEFCETAILYNMPLGEVLPELFEDLVTANYQRPSDRSINPLEFVIYDFMLWEWFITASSLLLQNEWYGGFVKILTHTYLLKYYGHKDGTEIYSTSPKFFQRNICKTNKMLEKQSNQIPWSVAILVERPPHSKITKEQLVDTDLVLYQLTQIHGIERWNPLTYIYQNTAQDIWGKLISEKYCQKILPLFNAQDIEELKRKIRKSEEDVEDFQYLCTVNEENPLSISEALRITSSIGISSIGVRN